jgi:NAD kinase
MHRLSENKIILVTRPTRLTELKRRFSTRSQAKFYVSHLGQDFSDYDREETEYSNAVQKAQQILELLGRVQLIDRSFLSNFAFGPNDVVVVLGQDGLVANTVKYLDGQPVVGVNPDPARWDGQLLPFQVRDLDKVVKEVFQGGRSKKSVTMAKATLNTGQTLYAVNDIFIGPQSHVSARYNISIGKRTENQSSSGVIVSTGVGSTGWLKSLLVGAAGIMQNSGSNPTRQVQQDLLSPPKLTTTSKPGNFVPKSEFPWDAQYLYFTVREPFPSKTTAATIVFGKVTSHDPLIIVSQMPEHGVIFSDGLEHDFMEFRSGTRATIAIAGKRGCLVV